MIRAFVVVVLFCATGIAVLVGADDLTLAADRYDAAAIAQQSAGETALWIAAGLFVLLLWAIHAAVRATVAKIAAAFNPNFRP